MVHSKDLLVFYVRSKHSKHIIFMNVIHSELPLIISHQLICTGRICSCELRMLHLLCKCLIEGIFSISFKYPFSTKFHWLQNSTKHFCCHIFPFRCVFSPFVQNGKMSDHLSSEFQNSNRIWKCHFVVAVNEHIVVDSFISLCFHLYIQWYQVRIISFEDDFSFSKCYAW